LRGLLPAAWRMTVRPTAHAYWRMRFSIIITCYNQGKLIKDAVDSALSARRDSEEIIVVDDGSTDGSRELLRSYGRAVRLVCREINGGAGVARNCGASVATGDFLVFLDGDDVLLPWALDVYQRIVERKEPKLILSRMQWFRGALPRAQAVAAPQSIRIVEYMDYMRKDRPFGNSASALVIDRRAFHQVSGWLQEMFPMDDQDLTFRLGDSGRTIQILSPATVLHREHEANSIHHIPPFIVVLFRMLERERQGGYPGGEPRRLERYGLLGGLILHWTKRAVKRGLYRDAATLLVQGWPMLAAAIARRCKAVFAGRRPSETLAIQEQGVRLYS